MTLEQLRDLDAQVAAEVMGWTQVSKGKGRIPTYTGLNPEFPDSLPCHVVPRYSTNIIESFEVLGAVDLDWVIEPHFVEFERPVEQDDGPMYYENKKYKAEIAYGTDSGAAATAYMICVAALKAVRDK